MLITGSAPGQLPEWDRSAGSFQMPALASSVPPPGIRSVKSLEVLRAGNALAHASSSAGSTLHGRPPIPYLEHLGSHHPVSAPFQVPICFSGPTPDHVRT